MTAVPLGINAYKRSSGWVPEVQLYNFYLEKDQSGISPDGTLRIQRPGLAPLETIAGPVRGLTVNRFDGAVVAVGGETLYIDFDPITGVIDGFENCAIVTTKLVTAICNGSTAYLYDGSLIEVAMPDSEIVVDIEQLDGYILLLCSTGRFYWILPGETTVDPLNFATAESSADAGTAIRRVGDEFWIFGPDSIEPWQSTGDQDSPFEPAVGRVMANGCLDRNTVRRFDNTLFWVHTDGNVYRGGAVPQVVSTNAIAEAVRNRSGDMAAWTMSVDGHSFYVLRIPGQGSWAYDASTQTWPKWGSEGQATWRAHVGYDAGTIYAGSADDGTIWTVNPEVAGDDGAPFARIVTGTVPITGPTRNDSLTVGVGASANTIMRLRWRDGQDDYPGYYEELEVRAPFDLATLYRLGQPQAPYREIEVSFVQAAFVRVAGCLANEGWR